MNGEPDKPSLPNLPDLDDLVRVAEARVDHFTRVRDAAQQQIDKAEEYLAKLKGEPAKEKRTRPRTIHEGTLKQVVSAAGDFTQGVAIATLASKVGRASSTISKAVLIGEERGYLRTERRQRGRKKVWVTDKGLEWVTS